MNFSPLLPRQLSFDFMGEPVEPLTPWARAGMGRSAYYNWRRTQRAVSAAFELCRRRRYGYGKPPPTAIIKPRPFHPTPAEACELKALATRVARLTVWHKAPEQFFIDRSEIMFELRRIASRAGGACHHA